MDPPCRVFSEIAVRYASSATTRGLYDPTLLSQAKCSPILLAKIAVHDEALDGPEAKYCACRFR